MRQLLVAGLLRMSRAMDAEGPNPALQEAIQSQSAGSGHCFEGSPHFSTSLGNPALLLFQTTAGRLDFPIH